MKNFVIPWCSDQVATDPQVDDDYNPNGPNFTFMITSVDQINIFPCHHQVASSKIMKITNNKLYGKIDRLNIEHGMVNYLGVHKHGIRVVTRKWQDLHGQLQWEHLKKHSLPLAFESGGYIDQSFTRRLSVKVGNFGHKKTQLSAGTPIA